MLPRSRGRRDSVSDLLNRVHDRLRLGIDLQTFADGTIEVRWRRDYDGEQSDERFLSGRGFAEILQGILDYEDSADERERAETA